MNLCELRVYNSMGVMTGRIDFMSEPFQLPLNLRIPKATRREMEVGNNLFRDGSTVVESRYNNAVISLNPMLLFRNCSRDESAVLIEAMSYQLNAILEVARQSTLGKNWGYVKLAEDSKGFILESEIIEGDFGFDEDTSSAASDQGIISSMGLSLTRKPFRSPPKDIILRNLIANPGFEVNNIFDVRPGGSPGSANSITGSAPLAWVPTASGGLGAAGSYGWSADCIEGGSALYLRQTNGTIKVANTTVDSMLPLPNGSFPSGDSLFYIEAWVCMLGNFATPTGYTVKLSFSTSSTLKCTWTYGEAVPNKSTVGYRNRRYNVNDWSTPTEWQSSPFFIRRGFFVKYSTVGTDWNNVQIILNNNGGNSDCIALVDRVMYCRASDFLNASQIATMQTKVGSGIYTVDPVNGVGIEWLPPSWSSFGQINQIMDVLDGSSTSWIDFEDIPGDVPAKVEIHFESGVHASSSGGGELKRISGGMKSAGVAYQQRRSLVLPFVLSTPVEPATGGTSGGEPYVATAHFAQFTLNPTVIAWDDTVSVFTGMTTLSYQNYNVRDKHRISGSYHAIIRITNTINYANVVARLIMKVSDASPLGSAPAQYIYGPDTSLPITNNTLGHWVSMDLGVVNVPPVEENTHISFGVQFRRVSATGSDPVICTEVMILIPCDEWFMSTTSVPGFTQSEEHALKKWGLRWGQLNNDEEIPAAIVYPAGLDSSGSPASARVALNYLSGSSPYFNPTIKNRVYFNFDEWQPGAVNWYNNYANNPNKCVAYATYRARYL